MATRPWNARSSRLDSSTFAASTVLEKDRAMASIKAVDHSISMSRYSPGVKTAQVIPK